MTEFEAQEFVRKFADAWATRDSEAFLAIWHPDGQLHSPKRHTLHQTVVGGLATLDLDVVEQRQ